jgi:hypothetical protein
MYIWTCNSANERILNQKMNGNWVAFNWMARVIVQLYRDNLNQTKTSPIVN